MKFLLSSFLTVGSGLFAFAQTDTLKRETDTLILYRTSPEKILLSDSINKVPDATPIFEKDSLYNESSILDSSSFSQKDASVLAATLSAGRTEATLDVSSAGGAEFTVPFILPPGIGDLVPELGLLYDSHGDNGSVGYGWEILGLSEITRVPETKYIDNRVGGINFDLNDRFALDGQRLVLKSGTYGGNGAEYQTENFSNLKIISRGVSPYGSGYGPEYFEVHYPDGLKAFYGSTSASRSKISYGLTYIENALGARISYEYITGNGLLYLSSVGYGSMGTTAPINRINFTYGTKVRAEQFSVAGQSFLRDRLLTKVTVVANNSNYRHYVVNYSTVATLNYQRVSSIQEFDGPETFSFSPISFSYNSTGNAVSRQTISNLSLTGIASNNSSVVTADFTGTGLIDFLLYPTAKNKFYAFYDLEPGSPYMQLGYEVNTGAFREIFPCTWLTSNSKVLAGQGMLLAKNNGYNKYKFEVYSSGTVTPVYYQYERLWDNPPLSNSYYSECDNSFHEGSPMTWDFISGDFNGDGLTEIVSFTRNQNVIVGEYPYDPQYPDECIPQWGNSGTLVYLINMDRRITSGFSTSLGSIYPFIEYGDKLYTADFNGDGKTDILHVKTGSMRVYTLSANNAYLQTLWTTTSSRITNNVNNPTLLGDYNGDGKMDVMFATGYNSVFAMFLSSGKDFQTHEPSMPFSNIQDSWDGTTMIQHFLMPTDINGDGKTDMLYSRSTTTNSSSTGFIYTAIYHNINVNSTHTPTFGNAITANVSANVRHNPIPIFLRSDRLNPSLEYGFISDNTITIFNSTKDMEKESQLASVSQDGVSHSIQYARLMADSYTDDLPVYSSSYDQTFPYYDIYYAPETYVATRFTRTYGSQQVRRVFSYSKLVANADGMGSLGFGERISTNWNTGTGDVNRNYEITITNPQLRGALMRTFVSKSTYINPTIKNMNLPANPPSTGIADGATLSDYISRFDNAYSTQITANKVFINVPVATATKDMLRGTYTTQVNVYDNTYYNKTKETNNIGGIRTEVTDITYANSTGTPYYIGRPLTYKVTKTSGTEVFSTEEQYTYTGYLVTQRKWKGHNTQFMTEDLTYDTRGNVTQRKTTEPGTAQRTESMLYDATGRFMTRFTNADAQATNYTYNSATGTRLTMTDVYGLSQTYGYDTWGRQVSLTDYLGKISTTTYVRVSSNIQITETGAEGQQDITVVNPLGQTIEQREKTVLGAMVGKAWQYDVYGRETGESEPAVPGSYTQWNTTAFDTYGRINKITEYTGKITNFTYSGMATTANDGIKSVITTLDALSRVSAVQDPGGTVNFTYFANDNLKSANYGGSTQSIEQNGWGQRTKLTDPSAGVYTMTYDGWGQLKTETTPKGTTTYNYDAAGKTTSKTIASGGTNAMQYVYSYNTTTKLPTQTVLTSSDGNNTTYTYAYDSYKRLNSTTEDNPYARFVRTYTFNTYGRIATDGVEATEKAGNITVTKTVANQYQNGELLQITLQGSGQVIWKVDAMTANGMLASALQGTSHKTTYTYSAQNFPQQRKLDRVTGTAATLMTLGTTFNAQRGFPTARSNSALTWNETFTYDNLDRLTNFNDNNGNSSHTYDTRGRITANSQLGGYTYSGTSYRQLELNLNTAAGTYYQTRSPQTVSYNAFNAPVEIVEPGQERISFEYNGTLNRAHMFYGGTQVNKLQRRYRRHYAEDGGAEITRDITTGTTSFVFYLGGDAYSAPAIWKQVHGPNPTTQTLYYLHRDYLGSIVMITGETGNIIEKRQFDAWGNVVKLTNGSNANLSTFGVLDRGFTGHEHLLKPALIHMNSRIYDAKIHRFLAPDNFIQQPIGTQNFNRYSYAMNNPLTFTDPSGDFLFGLLFGTRVGYNIQKALFHFALFIDVSLGSHQKGIGVDISMGMPTLMPLTPRRNLGVSYYWKNYDFGRGWETRTGVELSLGVVMEGVVGYTNYNSPGKQFDQRIGHTRLGPAAGPSITYGNDYFFGLALGDGGDRYRTTGAVIDFYPFEIGINLVTGDPGPSGQRNIQNINGQKHYFPTEDGQYDPDSHRAGVFYVGIGPFRFGKDSEQVRNYWQNEVAHKPNGFPFFRVLEHIKRKRYFQFGGGRLW